MEPFSGFSIFLPPKKCRQAFSYSGFYYTFAADLYKQYKV